MYDPQRSSSHEKKTIFPKLRWKMAIFKILLEYKCIFFLRKMTCPWVILHEKILGSPSILLYYSCCCGLEGGLNDKSPHDGTKMWMATLIFFSVRFPRGAFLHLKVIDSSSKSYFKYFEISEPRIT